MERIAVPIFQSRVSPVLDSCNDLMLVDLSEGGAVRRANVSLRKLSLGERVAAVSRQGVEKIICAGVSDLMMACIVSRGIQVISGLSGEVEQIIVAYQQTSWIRIASECQAVKNRNLDLPRNQRHTSPMAHKGTVPHGLTRTKRQQLLKFQQNPL